MTHVSANQFQLVPQASFGAGQLQGQQIAANRLGLDQKKASIKQAQQSTQFSRQALGGDKAALTELGATDIEQAKNIQSFLSTQSEEQRAETLRENDVLTRNALIAQTLPPEQRRAFIQRKREEAIQAGRSTDKVDRALAGSDEQLIQDIDLQAIAGQKISDVAKRLFPTAKPTSLQQNLIAAGLEPGTPEFQAAILKGVNKPLVSIGGEKKEQEALASLRVKQLGKFQEEREAAIDTNQSLDVLENIDVNTGALEPAKQGLAAFGKAFGLDTSGIANVTAGEAFNAEAQRLVLSVKASQKGPQTDKDEATIRETVASLGNTKAGNQFIIDSARALNNRKIERADFFDRLLEDTGSLKGANRDWAKFKRNTPMVSSNLRTPEGLPVFFYKFEQDVRNANPDASRAELLEAWRVADKGAK